MVASVATLLSAIAGQIFAAVFEGTYYYLAAMGIRERSRSAGIAAFTSYLLTSIAGLRLRRGVGILSIVFLALLAANVRGNWQSANWSKNPNDETPGRMNDTLGDKLADQMPRLLWPKAKYVFYVMAPIEIALNVAVLILFRAK